MVLTTLPTNKFFNFSHELNFSNFLFRLYILLYLSTVAWPKQHGWHEISAGVRDSDEFEKTFVDKLKTRNGDWFFSLFKNKNKIRSAFSKVKSLKNVQQHICCRLVYHWQSIPGLPNNGFDHFDFYDFWLLLILITFNPFNLPPNAANAAHTVISFHQKKYIISVSSNVDKNIFKTAI